MFKKGFDNCKNMQHSAGETGVRGDVGENLSIGMINSIFLVISVRINVFSHELMSNAEMAQEIYDAWDSSYQLRLLDQSLTQ